MQPDVLLVIALAFFLAAFIKGATGLGFSTSALAMLALSIGLKPALPLLIVPSLTSNALVMIDAGNFRETAKRFWPLYLFTLPGVAVGLLLLNAVDSTDAGAALGVVLAAYGLFSLARPAVVLPPSLERPLAPMVGFLTGTVNGLTGSQVMPVLPYLIALQLDPNRFIQAINISFTLSTLVMAAGLTQIGLMTPETALISCAGMIPVFLGVRAGAAVRRRLSDAVFRRLVFLFLVASGVALVVKPLT